MIGLIINRKGVVNSEEVRISCTDIGIFVSGL